MPPFAMTFFVSGRHEKFQYFGVPRRCSFADIAQLGERQTEDLKVPGSIPGVGNRSDSSVGRAWV